MTGPMLAPQDQTTVVPNQTPEQPWHMQKTPEEWQAINRKAMADFHASMAANPQAPDREALEAIKDSNDALNEYDKPAIEAGKHVLPTGYGDPVEALKGEARGFAGAATAPFHLANTMYRQGAGAGVDELLSGITNIPKMITSGDPEQIGELAGGTAGGIALGHLGAKLGGAARGAAGSLLERPALKNALLKAQTANALHGVERTAGTMDDLFEQSKLKTDTMKQNLEHKTQLQPDKVEQAGLKTNQMHQNVAEKAGTLHEDVKTPGLKNQLLRQQIEALQRQLDESAGEEGAGPSGSAPVNPKPPAGPPNDILSPREQAKLDPKAIDPYNLDELTKPTDPNDNMGNMINHLKQIDTMGQAPHDILSYKDLAGKTKPLTPEQINQLLRDIGGGPK